jgi:protein-S-isoprenylcysteine O-methyltransferase Ste14
MIDMLIIRACWLIFYVYWLVNSWSVKATAERLNTAKNLTYRILTLVGIVLLFWEELPYPLGVHVFPRTWATEGAGDIVCMAGLFIAVWARRTLATNWSSDVVLKQGHELVTRGPYRFVRHPIYTSILMMAAGTALFTSRVAGWIGLVILGVAFAIKIRYEEVLMTRNFPDQYPEYRRRVKALVPFLF